MYRVNLENTGLFTDKFLNYTIHRINWDKW